MRDRAENQITLVFIRHGETRANQEHRYLGKTDEALSEEGKKALSEFRKNKCYPEIDCLFASPMQRCLQTAKILYPDLEPVRIAEWTEMNFGAFEGKNYRELQDDKRYQEWIDSKGTIPFPEGESRENFILRCHNGFQKMIKQLEMEERKETRTVGLIVHGGTIMALLSNYHGGDYFDYQVSNGKGYIGKWKGFQNKPEIEDLKEIK